MIKTKCGSCDKSYKLPDSAAGKKFKCKSCDAVIAIPAADDSLAGGSRGPSLEDLSALYDTDVNSAPLTLDSGGAGGGTGFNSEVSFNYNKPKRSRSLSLPLLLGVGGGVLGLLLIVGVVAIILMSGSGEDGKKNDDPNAGGLALSNLSVPQLPKSLDSDPVKPDTTPSDTDSTDASGGQGADTTHDEPSSTQSTDGDDDLPTEVVQPTVEEQGGPGNDNVPDTPVVVVPSGLTTPTGKPYGLVMPDGFEIASTSRVAVRTQSMADGSWLSMEVHRLGSVDRRLAEPVNAEDGTVLLRGHRVPLPEGVVVSELTSDAFKIYRLLYPASDSAAIKQVAYVIKDGPYLITLRGHYPAASPDKLEAYDSAAKSIAKKG